eukprot:c6368_g1_i1.p1 GENE.c6368_g1_i1~~c6368_g1_i1.p1  ORF type:complete len:538 (+),score=137.89 c6368_g1_i1:95-1615(+)
MFRVLLVLCCVLCVVAGAAVKKPQQQTKCAAYRYWNRVYYQDPVTMQTTWNKPSNCYASAPVDDCAASASNSPVRLDANIATPKKTNIAPAPVVSLAEAGMNLESQAQSTVGAGVVKVFEGVHRAWEPFPPDTITLTIQANFERLQSGALNRIASQWNGPISCAVLSTSHSDVLYHLAHNANAAVKNWVDLHLALASQPWTNYPINKMRNIALKTARTKYVFLVDIDEDIPYPQSKYLEVLKQARPDSYTKAVFVMPSFQWAVENPPQDTPRDIAKLTKYFEKGQATTKHPEYPQAYESPEMGFWKWRQFSQPQETRYHDSYEPYFIATRGSIPTFDERFEGFGGNKAVHALRLGLEGYHLLMLPVVFTWSRDTPAEAGKYRAPPRPSLLTDAWWELGHGHGCDRCCFGCCALNCPQLFNKHLSQTPALSVAAQPQVQNIPVPAATQSTPVFAETQNIPVPTATENIPAQPQNVPPEPAPKVPITEVLAGETAVQSHVEPSSKVNA